VTFSLQKLIENLGQPLETPAIAGAIRDLGLTDVQDDPPARRYIGSKALGLSFLFHENVLIDVQIFVKPTKTYQAYSGALPYGLDFKLIQFDVHKFLGSPVKFDSSFSKYIMNDGRVKLIIEYDKSSAIRYISVSSVG